MSVYIALQARVDFDTLFESAELVSAQYHQGARHIDRASLEPCGMAADQTRTRYGTHSYGTKQATVDMFIFIPSGLLGVLGLVALVLYRALPEKEDS